MVEGGREGGRERGNGRGREGRREGEREWKRKGGREGEREWKREGMEKGRREGEREWKREGGNGRGREEGTEEGGEIACKMRAHEHLPSKVKVILLAKYLPVHPLTNCFSAFVCTLLLVQCIHFRNGQLRTQILSMRIIDP